MEDMKPAQFFMINDLETLRVLSDPLRMQIYEIVIPEALSVRQVAERLGLASSRLYYHINLLEKHGLIRVVETRMVANMVEKIYRASAYSIEIAPGLLNFNNAENREAVTDVILNHLDTTREDIQRSLQARLLALEQGAEGKLRSLMVNRVTANIPDEAAEEFMRRLKALLEEFGETDRKPGDDTQNYALTVAFYPTFYYSQNEPSE